jgi:hypothetical protein
LAIGVLLSDAATLPRAYPRHRGVTRRRRKIVEGFAGGISDLRERRFDQVTARRARIRQNSG